MKPDHVVDVEADPSELLGEVLPLDELLGDEERARPVRLFGRGLTRLEDRGDPGVSENGGGARFAQETLTGLGIAGALGTDEHQRHLALEHPVTGPIDDAHAPLTQAGDDVEVGDRARFHGRLDLRLGTTTR